MNKIDRLIARPIAAISAACAGLVGGTMVGHVIAGVAHDGAASLIAGLVFIFIAATMALVALDHV